MSACPARRPEGTRITESPEKALRLYPPPLKALPTGGVYSDLELLPASLPEERPYVLINMVSTVDGKAAVGGRAGHIGGESDRQAMRNLRALVDAVMIGAGTLRAEKLSLRIPEHLAREKGKQPLAVIVSKSGENLPIDANLLGSNNTDNTLILIPETPEKASDTTPGHRTEKLPPTEEGKVDLTAALRCLKKRYGINRLLVEGGPSLNHALLSQGLADELFLTISPRLLAGTAEKTSTIVEGPEFSSEAEPAVRLLSIHFSCEELFLRYSLDLHKGRTKSSGC